MTLAKIISSRRHHLDCTREVCLMLILALMSLPSKVRLQTASWVSLNVDSIQALLSVGPKDTSHAKQLMTLAHFYQFSANTDSALHYGHEILEVSQAIQSRKLEADAYFFIGNNYFHRYFKNEAVESFKQARLLYSEIGDFGMLSKAAEFLTYTYNQLAMPDSSVVYARETLKAAEKTRDTAQIVKAMLLQSNILVMFGMADAVMKIESYAQTLNALRLAELLGEQELIGKCYLNLAQILRDEQLYREAEQYYRLHLAYANTTRQPWDEGWSIYGLALVFQELGDYDSIYHYAQRMMLQFDRTGDQYHLSSAECFFGLHYNHLNEPSTAIQHFQNAMDNHSTTEDIRNDARFGIGKSYFIMGNYTLAIEYLEKAMNVAVTMQRSDMLLEVYPVLAEVYAKTFQFGLAYQALVEYRTLQDSMVNANTSFAIGKMGIERELLKKTQQVELLEKEKQVQSLIAQRNEQQKRITYLGAGVLLCIISFVFYRYRVGKQKEREQALVNERLRISRELHDEVGATLSGIKMYSHLAKEQIRSANLPEVKHSLDIMQESSGEMVNKLNDIVWLLNPDQADLQKLLDKLEDYARQMGKAKGMQVHVSVPEEIKGIELPIEHRRNIYLICKEAINNAVKCSEATLLNLEVKNSDHTLEFIVQDDGEGFDPEHVKKGNGLENMKRRAEELGAKFKVESSMDRGTTLLLQCPAR